MQVLLKGGREKRGMGGEGEGQEDEKGVDFGYGQDRRGAKKTHRYNCTTLVLSMPDLAASVERGGSKAGVGFSGEWGSFRETAKV